MASYVGASDSASKLDRNGGTKINQHEQVGSAIGDNYHGEKGTESRAQSDTPQTYGTLNKPAWEPSRYQQGRARAANGMFYSARIAARTARNVFGKRRFAVRSAEKVCVRGVPVHEC